MKKIKKIEASKLYLFKSTACANSVYFESEELIKLFFRYFNYYLKDYIQIHEFALNKDGWVVLVKIKSEKTIRKHHSKKLNCTRIKTKREIWRIISDRIRVFISTYVRMSNKILGRNGTLVRKNFERYEFESRHELEKYIKSIRLNKISRSQPKKKYKGNLKHFRVKKRFIKNLTSKRFKSLTPEKFSKKTYKIFGCKLSILRNVSNLVECLFNYETNSVIMDEKLSP